VTLGEEVARVISGEKSAPADDLLSRDFVSSTRIGKYPTLFLPHPDACRRYEKWRMGMMHRVAMIKESPFWKD
jgi:hypothetical protein